MGTAAGYRIDVNQNGLQGYLPLKPPAARGPISRSAKLPVVANPPPAPY
jgi:hypothetical protein